MRVGEEVGEEVVHIINDGGRAIVVMWLLLGVGGELWSGNRGLDSFIVVIVEG